MSGVGEKVSKATADFLKSNRGRHVVVKLTSGGVEYRGTLTCVDEHMNIVMKQTEEYVNGQLRNEHGYAYIRGNNVLYIGTIKNEPYQQQISASLPNATDRASTSSLPNAETEYQQISASVPNATDGASTSYLPNAKTEYQQISASLPNATDGASTSYSQELVAETDSTSTTESEDLESEKAPFDKERLAALMKSRGKKKKRQAKKPEKKKTYKKREKRQFHDPIDN